MDSAGGFPRAVVFDLDGTLVDSAADIAGALGRALAGEGLPGFDTETVKGLVGGGSRRLIERALAVLGVEAVPARVEDLRRAFEDQYLAAPCRSTRLYPGARELLATLSARGVALGVCTNKPEAITLSVLDALGLARTFGAVAGGSDTLALKPDPAMLVSVLSRLGAGPDEGVLIGDSAADVGAARGAGCGVVLVSFGYASGNAVALGADAVVDDFAEVPLVLAQLFSRARRTGTSFPPLSAPGEK